MLITFYIWVVNYKDCKSFNTLWDVLRDETALRHIVWIKQPKTSKERYYNFPNV